VATSLLHDTKVELNTSITAHESSSVNSSGLINANVKIVGQQHQSAPVELLLTRDLTMALARFNSQLKTLKSNSTTTPRHEDTTVSSTPTRLFLYKVDVTAPQVVLVFSAPKPSPVGPVLDSAMRDTEFARLVVNSTLIHAETMSMAQLTSLSITSIQMTNPEVRITQYTS